MKMVVHREGLLSACQLVSAAIASKEVKPVLRNVKAIVEADRCTLMATDLEVGIRLDLRGIRVEDPGEALLPTSRIISILREATDDELTIEAGMEACSVTGATTEFEMAGEDPAAFPDVPAFADDQCHEITAGVLREMIRRTSFAVSSAEHSRFGATIGVLWELEPDRINLVGTDGRRLSLASGAAQVKGDVANKGQLPVVPLKAMTLLDRVLAEPDELVRVAFRPNEVVIKTERAMIYSRLVEGKFPTYRQVIPKDHAHRLSLTVGPFHSAVRQAAVMVDDESKRVVFRFDKNKLTLQARGAETGRSKVELPIDFGGKALEINFDPKFLGDMLKVLEPDSSVTLDLLDGNSPAVFRQEPNYTYVLVPLVTK
jgi:DNA polymerase-3 subunit beta